jgi:hypothetical protein
VLANGRALRQSVWHENGDARFISQGASPSGLCCERRRVVGDALRQAIRPDCTGEPPAPFWGQASIWASRVLFRLIPFRPRNGKGQCEVFARHGTVDQWRHDALGASGTHSASGGNAGTEGAVQRHVQSNPDNRGSRSP